MEKLSVCRLCLVKNVRMFEVTDKNLHELFEKLTDIPFVTADSRPMLACFFCYAKLKQCCQLQRKCWEAEELFAQMMNEPNVFTNRGQVENVYGLVMTQTENISIVDVGQVKSVTIKQELPAVCERLEDIINPKEEHQSDGKGLENVQNSYLDIKDISAPQSDSDTEGDVSLTDFKIEVEEKQVSKRASDTIRMPVVLVKKLKLDRCRIKLGDATTEEQRNIEKPHSKVVPTTQTRSEKPRVDNGISNTVFEISKRNNTTKDDIKSKISNKDDDMNKHQSLCVKEKRFKCDICQRSFNFKHHLTYHIRTHTGEKPFKCDVCQRFFVQKSILNRHIRIHAGERPFKCDVCQHCFRDKSHLNRHIRTHTGEKPFKCDVCQRCFGWKQALDVHIRIHTGEKPFKCDICQRCFSQKNTFDYHVRKHTDEKPFKCDLCHRCFRDKSHLYRHILTHTGEKLFKCDLCQRSFRGKCGLNTHIRTHTGEKPFKCDLCQRSFLAKYSLNSHNRTHTGEKPFKCDVCQRCFIHKNSLNKHIHTHH